MEIVTELLSWAPESLQKVIAAMKLKEACSLEKKLRITYPSNWEAGGTIFCSREVGADTAVGLGNMVELRCFVGR